MEILKSSTLNVVYEKMYLFQLLKYSSAITILPTNVQTVHSVPPYLVPLLQLVVGELGVLPEVLQHLWPQLAVLFPHVSGTRLSPSQQQ